MNKAELQTRAERREARKKKKMKVSGASVRALAKIIRGKAKP
ncbi:MAG: hypothetical protein PHW53_02090 [Patescibacteria group bacterium]|nr:hypothetical protein [Patescibacteria group bacterium]